MEGPHPAVPQEFLPVPQQGAQDPVEEAWGLQLEKRRKARRLGVSGNLGVPRIKIPSLKAFMRWVPEEKDKNG